MIKCKKHPRYKGKGKPQSHCLDCWRIWLSDPYIHRWQEELTIYEINTIMMIMGGYYEAY